jgi:hypothetical protein
LQRMIPETVRSMARRTGARAMLLTLMAVAEPLILATPAAAQLGAGPPPTAGPAVPRARPDAAPNSAPKAAPAPADDDDDADTARRPDGPERGPRDGGPMNPGCPVYERELELVV